MNTLKVAWIGLGAMGRPMAARLVAAGYRLAAYDLNVEAARHWAVALAGPSNSEPRSPAPESLSSQSAQSAAHAIAGDGCVRIHERVVDAVEGADVVFTIVPTSTEVAAVALGAEGLVQASRKPKLLVDMTSGEPARTREIAAELAKHGIAMIDAPVSGGVPRARTGELAIMLGGDPAWADFVRPLLDRLGTTITAVGELGAGQAMKALNNLASAGGFLIAIEALAVATKFGIDPSRALDVLNSSTGMNNSTQKKFRQFVLSGTYASGFSLDLMVKDLGIAQSVGRSVTASTPFTDICVERWRDAAAQLGRGHDHTEIARVAAGLAGVRLENDRQD